MQKIQGDILYAASDIVNFLECAHLTRLDLINLDTPLPKDEESEEVQLLQDRGYAHEAAFSDMLATRHQSICDIASQASEIEQMREATLSAMDAGIEIICQATLKKDSLLGHIDFLRRVPVPSRFGDYSYEVIDTKLARKIKTKFIIQTACYSSLLSSVQEVTPERMHIVFGNRAEESLHYADYAYYFTTILARFSDFVQGRQQDTYPSPCSHCDYCCWRTLCKLRWIEDDHLSQVAGITKLQIKKLQAAGITTLAELGTCTTDLKVAKMSTATLEKLSGQASLQLQARENGRRPVELLPQQPGKKGFARLPQPAAGDLFFDMEGDPLTDGGLEYLFGIYFFSAGKPLFNLSSRKDITRKYN